MIVSLVVQNLSDCNNITLEKYKIFPLNTTIHFHCNRATWVAIEVNICVWWEVCVFIYINIQTQCDDNHTTSNNVSILTILNWNKRSTINVSSKNVRTHLAQDWHCQFQSQETLIELQQFTLTMSVETFRNFRMNLLVWNMVLILVFHNAPYIHDNLFILPVVSSSQPQLLWGLKSGIIFVWVINP